MLARTPASLVYLSAEELGITTAERAGLIEVRDDLASGRVKHATMIRGTIIDDAGFCFDDLFFNMDSYHAQTDCGTAHCIAGFLQARGVYPKDKDLLSDYYTPTLSRLFNPVSISTSFWKNLTAAQAARAIDHFLSGAGSDCWPMALADIPL